MKWSEKYQMLGIQNRHIFKKVSIDEDSVISLKDLDSEIQESFNDVVNKHTISKYAESFRNSMERISTIPALYTCSILLFLCVFA